MVPARIQGAYGVELGGSSAVGALLPCRRHAKLLWVSLPTSPYQRTLDFPKRRQQAVWGIGERLERDNRSREEQRASRHPEMSKAPWTKKPLHVPCLHVPRGLGV